MKKVVRPDEWLFPDPPSQRHSETSRAAAANIAPEAGTLRAKVLAFIVTAGENGATDQEIQDGLGMDGNTERPRRRELEKGGFIVDSGRTRVCRSKQAAVVWVAKSTLTEVE